MSSSLPIQAIRAEFIQACAGHSRVILTAPTGSGKSTRVPGFLADEVLPNGGQVVCLQPRRLAARMLARRVAAERGAALGGEVGYRVRFDQCAGPATRIIYETDGILLQELRHDPDLRRVGAIVFDEFHERHLFGDVLLGLALDLQAGRRPDLKIAVMSATMDAAAVETFLKPCARIQAGGRCFPVEIRYHPAGRQSAAAPVWELAAQAAAQPAPAGGHTLIFMPGAHEIRRTVSALQSIAGVRANRIFPLYGELSPAAQDAAVAPDDTPKIIVATNIAETSITIDGVTLVIDSGLARRAGYDPEHGINTLLVEKISRAAADQRAGRAGRTAPGVCLRLWTAEEHERRPAAETPEVARLDLSEVVLGLRALGLGDLRAFRWLEPPAAERLQYTEEFLKSIGALRTTDGAVTGLGRRLLDFPVHPRWGRLLLTAADYGCVPEAALLAALAQEHGMLANAAAPARALTPAGAARRAGHQGSLRQSDLDRDIRARRAELADPEWESDLLLRLRLWQAAAAQNFSREVCDQLGLHAGACRRVDEMRGQFLRIAGRLGSPGAAGGRGNAPAVSVLKCLLAAFPDQVARRVSAGAARVELVHGRRGSLAPDSTVRQARLMVAPEIRRLEARRGEVETRITMASAIVPEWLEELFPEHLRRERRLEYDAVQRRAAARADLFFRDLMVAAGPAEQPTADEAAAVLADEVQAGRLVLKEWTPAVEQWLTRLNNLAAWCPELGLPPAGPDARRHLLEQICHGAFSYREIKERAVLPVVQNWLSAPQQALLAKYAPERATLANGRNVRLVYEDGRAPSFSARIQELYDVPACPAIAMGRVRVRVNILAPNQRPVQITDDLASFWAHGYQQAKKDLRGRYPKHEWR